PAGQLDLATARSLVEARQLIGPQVASLAAQRHSAKVTHQMREAHAQAETQATSLAAQRHSVKVTHQMREAHAEGETQATSPAAQRDSATLTQRMHDAIVQVETETDPVRRQWHQLAYWDALVDGAESIVFRLMYNSLRAAYEPMIGALASVLH